MPSHFLYSTNSFLKKLIQETYMNNIHYVWCSEHFDSRSLAKHAAGSLIPPTSNPSEIYEDLLKAAQKGDKHNEKILNQKVAFIKRATEWRKTGKITKNQLEDIAYMVEHSETKDWRPLLYIIPRNIIAPKRLKEVPMKDRAGLGMEYIIRDLKSDEFDVLEFNYA